MRVLVTTQPAHRHLHPLVPTAGALAAAGHQVTLASSRSFAPQLRATGLDAVAAGVDWLESDLLAAFPTLQGTAARPASATSS